MSDIKAGDRVVCVNDIFATDLHKGQIYTVDDLKMILDKPALRLQEVGDSNSYFVASRFLPVGKVTAGLDSEKFSEIQNKVIAAIDETVKLPNAQGGIKFDLGKKDYTLLLQDLKVTVDEVTDVLELGAKKYSRGNYKLIESDRYHKALLRHIMSYLSGELTDPETGKHHLAHAICCAAFLIEREVKTNESK